MPLVGRVCCLQEVVSDAIARRDLSGIFDCFAADPLVTCSMADAKLLFQEMVENTTKYLTSFDLTTLQTTNPGAQLLRGAFLSKFSPKECTNICFFPFFYVKIASTNHIMR